MDEVYNKTLKSCQAELRGKTVTMALDGWSNVHQDPIVGISISDSVGNFAMTNSIDTSGHRHDAEYLKTIADAELRKCETEYNVRVGAFVTDNTGNVAKLRRELTLNPDTDIIQYGCTAHILNLLSKDVNISYVSAFVIKIIKYFKHTHLPKFWYKRAGGKRLVIPIEVRWNTIHDTIASFLANRGVLIQVCQDRKNEIDKEISKLVNDQNLASNCLDYSSRMKPIAIALHRAQRNQTTIAIAVEIWIKLRRDLEGQPQHVKTAFEARKKMALGPDHFLANMTDHRFCGARLSAEEKQSAYDHLAKINPDFVPILMAHCAQAEPFKPYLYLPSVRDTNPITWWKSVEISTSNVSFNWTQLQEEWLSLCDELMSAIATTASLERTFSTKKLVHSKLRNKLGNTKAGKLTFMYKWMNRSEEKPSKINWVWDIEDSGDLDVEIVEDSDSENSEDEAPEPEPEVMNWSENEEEN